MVRATLWCHLHSKLPTLIASAPEPTAPTMVPVLLVKLLIRITAMMRLDTRKNMSHLPLGHSERRRGIQRRTSTFTRPIVLDFMS